MFEDVAQMEKEIETFRKNIAASSELVEAVSQLTDTTKHQEESFCASADKLLKRMDDCVSQIRNDHEAALHALSSNNDATIASLQKNMSSEQVARLQELELLKTDLEKMLASYTDGLHKTEQAIHDYQTEAEKTYGDFVHRLESTNVDQIFREVQDLKRALQTKFIILLSGMGLATAVAVSSLFIK